MRRPLSLERSSACLYSIQLSGVAVGVVVPSGVGVGVIARGVDVGGASTSVRGGPSNGKKVW